VVVQQEEHLLLQARPALVVLVALLPYPVYQEQLRELLPFKVVLAESAVLLPLKPDYQVPVAMVVQ
jgi:hypothetical protein